MPTTTRTDPKGKCNRAERGGRPDTQQPRHGLLQAGPSSVSPAGEPAAWAFPHPAGWSLPVDEAELTSTLLLTSPPPPPSPPGVSSHFSQSPNPLKCLLKKRTKQTKNRKAIIVEEQGSPPKFQPLHPSHSLLLLANRRLLLLVVVLQIRSPSTLEVFVNL